MTSLEKIGLVSSVVAAAASVLVVIVGAAYLFGSMSGQVDDNTGDLASMKDDVSRLMTCTNCGKALLPPTWAG